MLGVLINAAALALGGILGLLIGKLIPERLRGIVLSGLALGVIYVAITGMLAGQNTLVLILSVLFGALIGELLDLDGRLNKLGQRIEQRFSKKGDLPLAQGFVTGTLTLCIGAMAVVGSLQAGLTGNIDILLSKALLDFVFAIVLAANLGVGVVLAAVSLLIFQGSIVLAAQALYPLLTDFVVGEMTAVGSLLLLALGLNLLGITRLKLMNFLPAVFMPILLGLFF